MFAKARAVLILVLIFSMYRYFVMAESQILVPAVWIIVTCFMPVVKLWLVSSFQIGMVLLIDWLVASFLVGKSRRRSWY